ncbi:MAG TPA: hypothetical protein VGF32_20730, partial [Streptosporangiaceae bacterium]
RGHSPWRRGARCDQQVLICPTCQGMHDWKADLDQCSRCGSVRLVRRLGEVECRDCGFVLAPKTTVAPEAVAVPERIAVPEGAVPGGVAAHGGVAAATGGGVGRDAEVPGLSGTEVRGLSGGEAPGLSEEVARALERVLGRGPARR